MKEHYYLFREEDFKDQLQNEGRFIALANPKEVYWAPLDVGVTHEQMAQSIGKDPRKMENVEWFEQFVRLRFDLKEKIVWWTFGLLTSDDPYQNKKRIHAHYDLGFITLNALRTKYPQLGGLSVEIADVGGILDKYSYVNTFRETNGEWKLVEMSIAEKRRGTTLEAAQKKYNPKIEGLI